LDLSPPCPLSIDALAVVEEFFAPAVSGVQAGGGSGLDQAYQLDRYVSTRAIISQAIRKRSGGRRHSGSHDWRRLIDETLPPIDREDEEEEHARREKAAALEELYRARFCSLIGAAGTGKTTLLKVLSSIPEVRDRGIMMLAPTGKARVRMETQTGIKGAQTIAQFLNALDRYDGETGRYLLGGGKRAGDHKTVVIDECSMLTEEQLAATIDALAGVERLLLVGDPRQLPPIGAGRPFLDIVRETRPPAVEGMFPKVGTGYAELTVTRRQRGLAREDLLLADWFSGRPCDPGADEIWTRLAASRSGHLRLISWATPGELEQRLLAALVEELGLGGSDDQVGFERSIGGIEYKGYVYFNCSMPASRDYPAKEGSAACAEKWQILSPVRAHDHGVDAVNRSVQRRFRKRMLELSKPEKDYLRKLPRPLGSQAIVYGDKVISVENQRRYDHWPKVGSYVYVANGDIGIVVGQFRSKALKKAPWKAEIEFASQRGVKVGYRPSEFSDEASPPVELAYALTIHKAQGSEFGVTFVILPNPCRLLSRELMYTAFTRQQDRLVLLHQGDIREFLKYTRAEFSEGAQRLTNLFTNPRPVAIQVATKQRFLEDGLIHRTERGELVRSKSELVIADKLFAAGVPYLYEQPVQLDDGSIRYPDFTVMDDATGETVHWEHLGLLEEPSYRSRWEAKLRAYKASGILPLEEGRGGRGALIVTRDDPNGGLDAGRIAELVRQVFGER
jgi:hypothetical protein